MALSSQGGFDSQEDISPFISVGNQTDTPDNIQTPASVSAISSGGAVLGNLPYALRIQSNHFYDDNSVHEADQIISLLQRDLFNRVTRVKEGLLVESMFPDEAFGFPINEKFVENFYNVFLNNYGSLDPTNFKSEKITEVFLNRMISTIADFLNATKQLPTFKPLRYFTSAYSDTPLKGQPLKRKPDIILVSLVDGHIRKDDNLRWDDVHAFIEHTIEARTPQRMPNTITVKSFLAFCSQPERDFFISLGFNGKGFFIVVTDHVGQIDTDIIPFSNSLIFLRMLMGLAFLPESLIGKDSTITRIGASKLSGDKFDILYPKIPYHNPTPSIRLMASSSSSSVDGPFTSISTSSPESSGSIDATSTPVSPKQIYTISVGPTIYKVVGVLFKSRTLIGRATTVFLVQLPDKRFGVLKDSWITTDRPQEAEFLQNLCIPFGPQLVNHCILRNTRDLRKHAVIPSPNSECREKRRIVTFPAGVHISDFTSLWELMVAFLDIVIGMEDWLLLSFPAFDTFL
jgi:Fungal protein kinase